MTNCIKHLQVSCNFSNISINKDTNKIRNEINNYICDHKQKYSLFLKTTKNLIMEMHLNNDKIMKIIISSWNNLCFFFSLFIFKSISQMSKWKSQKFPCFRHFYAKVAILIRWQLYENNPTRKFFFKKKLN